MGRSQIARMRWRHGIRVALPVAAALAALPSTAMAATETIGPPVLNTSANFVACSTPCVTKTVALTTATDPNTVVSVPADGTITGWTVIGSVGVPATISLRILRPDGAGQFKGVGTSAGATVINGSAENATSLPVKAGDLIGADMHASGGAGAGVAIQTGNVGSHSIWESPGLADGATAIPSTNANDGLLMLNATLAFGGPTTTTVSVATKGSAIRAQGSVKPFAPGLELKLTLFQKQHGNFKKIDSAHPALNTNGKYSSEFPRPKPGTCKLTAKFPGDSNYAASSATKKFAC